MKKSLMISLVLFAISANAQNQIYDFYAFNLGNMVNVNPAYCAQNNGVNVVLNAQSQNAGVSYANKNYMAGVYSKLSEKQGVGARLISDTRGAFQLMKADLSYAFVAQINKDHTLKLGLSAGVIHSNLAVRKIENFESLDQSDPSLQNTNFNTTQFTSGAGLLYSFKALDVSVSLPHIITTSQPLNSYLHSAVFYKFKLSKDFNLQPWASFQNIPITKNVGSLYARAIYKDMFWLQSGYQTNGSILAGFGSNFENIGVSYGFRLSNNNFKVVTNSIHEIVFTMKIGKGRDKTSSGDLDSILKKIEELLNNTPDSKEKLQREMDKIKKQVAKAEIDNSNPQNAKVVEQQLLLIDEKLKMLENKLKNE